MKSNKQRRSEIKARRARHAAKRAAPERPRPRGLPVGAAVVNSALLRPHNSYGLTFEVRGYYEDLAFDCKDCGRQEVWTATQQKWWYEVAKGEVNSTAVRCRACRRRERQRAAEARRVHLEGAACKQAERANRGRKREGRTDERT
jgi:hypothetical protein